MGCLARVPTRSYTRASDGGARVTDPNEPKVFADDGDTVPTCTGACCDPVVMYQSQYEDMSRNPKSHPNGRYVLNMLSGRRPSSRAPGMLEFDCKYFDRETRRCTAYDRRPKMCRTYPDEGECYLCGAKMG